MTQPDQDTTTQPEDDDPRTLMGAPASPPEGAEPGALYTDEEL